MPSPNLEQLAKDALAAVAGRLDIQEYDRLAAAGDLEKIQCRYLHADGALFANTVAAITGWPVVAAAAPDGPLQHLVAMPADAAGQLVDVTGLVSAEDLQQRSNTGDFTIMPCAPFGPCADHDHLPVVQLLAHLDYPPFNGLAFQRRLRAFSAELQVDADALPARVTDEELEQAATANVVLTANRFLAQLFDGQVLRADVPAQIPCIQGCVATAADMNSVDFVRTFLDAPSLPLEFHDGGYNWLDVATSAGALQTVALLAQHPRSKHLVTDARAGRPTSLHYAAYHSHVDVASVLIAAGANVNAAGVLGQTPLHRCLATRGVNDTAPRQLAMAKLLLEHGADPLLFDNCGDAALHCAVAAGLGDIVPLLLQHGVPIDHTGPEHSVPPIFRAAEHWRTDMVETLRALGADTNARSPAGHTLLTHCILSIATDPARRTTSLSRLGADAAIGELDMVKHLLDVVGLDPDQPNLNGNTAETLARDLPSVRQVLATFRARRAMAGALTRPLPATPQR